MTSSCEYLTSEDLEGMTGTPASTFRYWAAIGTGPPSFKLGRRRVWKRSDVEAWLEDQRGQQPRLDAQSEAAELAPQVRQAVRCYMGGDHTGWATAINESPYPVRVFAAAMSNALAKLAAQSDDPEHFLDQVAAIVARD